VLVSQGRVKEAEEAVAAASALLVAKGNDALRDRLRV